MNRLIMHVDMDAYFASVEQMANPALRGQPVFVTAVPSKRSVVAACSYEARPMGVRSGMSVMKALQLCPQAILVEGNPGKYVTISKEIFRTLKTLTPYVEPYSIDESFMEFRDKAIETYGAQEMTALSRQVQTAVYEATGLTCSAGAAPNKLVAKLASEFNKPNGVTVVPQDRVESFLFGLPIKEMWGIGPKTQKVMYRLGVNTVGDLRQFEKEHLVELFGVAGEYFYNAARGIDDRPLIADWETAAVKSVGHSHTLAANTTNRDILIGLLHALCGKVARRMKIGKTIGRTVTVSIRYGNLGYISRSISQQTPIESETMIYHLAKGLLFGSWDGRRPIRLLGVSVSNLQSTKKERQMQLFADPHDIKMDETSEALRTVQDRYGEGSIKFGSSIHLGQRPLELPHGLGHTGLAGPLRDRRAAETLK